jgi:flagellar biosynthesis protein FliP
MFSAILPTAAGGAEISSSLLSNLGIMSALAALPVLIVAGTSFLKISVVLGLLRSAVGAQDVPPTLVITALSAVLTLFVMAPVAEEMFFAAESAQVSAANKKDPYGIEAARAIYNAASPVMRGFLNANTSDTEKSFYMDLAGGGAEEDSFRILLPAFATQEIVEAFWIGVLIFLPFLLVDLIVSAALVSLGFNMLSPAAVSLPLKLLLLTAVDGWHIILSGLLVNYGV